MEENKRPTKILIECPRLIPSVRVGVMRPLSFWERRGECELRYLDTKEIRQKDIAWCDIVVCVRGCEKPTVQFLQAAKQAGRFLIYFLDDDLLDIPHGNKSTNYFNDLEIRGNLLQALSKCDVMWTVNPRIAEKYRQWCGRTVLSGIPAEVSRKPPEFSEKIHVLYAGSVDHNGLIKERLSYAVTKLLREYPGMVDFTFIGADPGLVGLPGVRHYSFFASYDEYRRVISEGGFTVGLAPSFHTPFYACKYFNKYVEYTENGIAGVYENCEPYTFVVRDGENGFLCGQEAEDWYQKLKELLSDRDKIKAVALRSAEVLEENFSLEQIGRKLNETIPELTYFRGREISENEVKLPSLWWSFYKERIRLISRIYGMLSFVVIPWKTCKVIGKLMRKKLRQG